MGVILHIIQSTAVCEDDHVQVFLQVAHGLQLLDKTGPPLPLPLLLLLGSSRSLFGYLRAVTELARAVLIVIGAGVWGALPGREARRGIIVHSSTQG
jgi:hypothetical protein